MSCITGGNTTTYKYGADGLRRQSTKNGVSLDYANDGSMLVREGHATGGSLTPATVTATYFQGASGPCYRRDDTQTEIDSQGRTVTKARWYVYDGLGSVVGELDPLGDLTSSPKYDVYGAVRANGGTASSKQGFVGGLGHVSDTETGLVYMRGRYMDPTTGRFVSEDPQLDGLNWYAYCDDNPTNKVDSTGKAGEISTSEWGHLLGDLAGMITAGILCPIFAHIAAMWTLGFSMICTMISNSANSGPISQQEGSADKVSALACMAMVTGISYASGRLAGLSGLSGAANIAAFVAGYGFMIDATMILLDKEVTASTGGNVISG